MLTLTARESACLVGRDGREPRSETLRLPEGPQLAPGDRPGGRDRLVGDLDVAADEIGDPHHVVVMCCDDPSEGGLIACRCVLNDIDTERPTDDARHTL